MNCDAVRGAFIFSIEMDSVMELLNSAAKRQKLNHEMSEPEILELVSRREAARQARRFEESDAIRQELRDRGVELYDKEKEWRAKDGRRGSLFTAGAAECVLSDAEIQNQIGQRDEARKNKDFDTADRIREALRQMGVELLDKEAVWRTGSGRSGSYSGAPVASQSGNLTGAAIRKLVSERERMRSLQDFEAADELRRQLAQLGVELFEQEVPRLWRTTDGMLGVIFPGGQEVACPLGDRDIVARVARREDARQQKAFAEADQIREDLRNCGVELLDKEKEWCTTDGRHGGYVGGNNSAGGVGIPSAASMQAAVGNPYVQADPFGLLGQQLAAAVPGANAATLAAGLAQLLTPQAAAPAAQAGYGALGASNASVLAALGLGGGVVPGLSSAVTSSPSAGTLTDAAIAALVAGRESARERHDWQAADAIRNDLRSHGVDVWDKEKVWRANDGRSGMIARLGI